MKLNKKGFTLVELLVAIVILSLVMVISGTAGYNVYKDAKIRSEEVFVKQINKAIENYITLNYDKFSQTTGNFIYQEHGLNTTNIPFSALIFDNLITEKEFKSPFNENIKCNINNEDSKSYFKIWINNEDDSDDKLDNFVYQWKLSCISEYNLIPKYKDTTKWVYISKYDFSDEIEE